MIAPNAKAVDPTDPAAAYQSLGILLQAVAWIRDSNYDGRQRCSWCTMQSIYHLNANELDDQFLESLKVLFGDRRIEIVVSSVDETEYLMSNPANREHLLRAIKNVEEGRNLITVQLEDLQLTE